MKAKQQVRGFSLVEMLVVIAIIGVISAIAVPQISNFTDAAVMTKAQRNAQNLVMVATAAKAAGLDFTGSNTVDQAIANVIAGSEITSGAFAGEFFGVPNVGLQEAIVASAYLKVDGKTLQYVQAGGQTQITALPSPNL